MRKPRKVMHEVSGLGKQGRYRVRNQAAAVKKFRKQFHLSRCSAFTANRETGGWAGVSVDVVPNAVGSG